MKCCKPATIPKTRETAATMGKHISRMENYVSSMSNLRRMEDTQPEYKLIGLQPLVSSLYDSAKIVCAKNAKELTFTKSYTQFTVDPLTAHLFHRSAITCLPTRFDMPRLR